MLSKSLGCDEVVEMGEDGFWSAFRYSGGFLKTTRLGSFLLVRRRRRGAIHVVSEPLHPSPYSTFAPIALQRLILLLRSMLYFVGLGLADESDITVKGLEIVKKAERVYLEAYTSILLVETEKLEQYYGRSVFLADREMVESGSDELLEGADKVDIAFLVVGDPFGATTHTDLALRARELGIKTKTIPNASIMSAIGCTGLQLYHFGQTVSMVFFTETWKPTSFYDRIKENVQIGLHTLVLLDIKVKEQSLENMARGRKIFEPPRYMTVAQCASQMIESEETRQEGAYGPKSLAIGLARVGADDQQLAAGTLEELSSLDMGAPLHSLVLLGRNTHDLEIDFIREFAVDQATFDDAWKSHSKGS